MDGILSPADVAVLSGNTGNGNNNNGWGDNGAWWIILFLIFGFGRNGYETRLGIQGLNAELASCCCDLKTQIADCCCQTQRGIDGINYNMAMNTNNLQQTLCNNTRDIIDNQNANYRALHDEIVANRMEDKNAQITAQQNEINALRLKASQEAQNTYLINQLKPCPSAAYIVPNPNCCYNYSVNGFGYNNCNCGNF